MIYEKMSCPLPVLRRDDEDSWVFALCQEHVCVVTTGTGTVTREPIRDVDDRPIGSQWEGTNDDVTQWRVECHAGHVLLLLDIEDGTARWDDGFDWVLDTIETISWQQP